jgi:hypothetical protein
MDELVALVDPQPGQANPKFSPVRGRTNVVMFVGLQGAGKTTTVSKLALQYKRRGWKVAMVCADTFRAGADHQLLQLARSIKVPAYADGSQFDPVVVAREGIDCFKREECEIILVDTSGRHKQEAQLFEEMEQLAAAVVRPAEYFNSMKHLTTRVVSCRVVVLCAAAEPGHGDVRAGRHDRPNGLRPSAGLQGAHPHRFHHCDQARRPRPRRRCPLCVRSSPISSPPPDEGVAHKISFSFSFFLLDIGSVAAANCPITHIGTGERMDDLESFDPRGFIQKMLGTPSFFIITFIFSLKS